MAHDDHRGLAQREGVEEGKTRQELQLLWACSDVPFDCCVSADFSVLLLEH